MLLSSHKKKNLENNINYIQLIDADNYNAECRSGIHKVWKCWEIHMMLSRECSMYIKNIYVSRIYRYLYNKLINSIQH